MYVDWLRFRLTSYGLHSFHQASRERRSHTGNNAEVTNMTCPLSQQPVTPWSAGKDNIDRGNLGNRTETSSHSDKDYHLNLNEARLVSNSGHMQESNVASHIRASPTQATHQLGHGPRSVHDGEDGPDVDAVQTVGCDDVNAVQTVGCADVDAVQRVGCDDVDADQTVGCADVDADQTVGCADVDHKLTEQLLMCNSKMTVDSALSDKNDNYSNDQVELMTLQSLTQSVLDVEGKAESGAEFVTSPSVQKRSFNKYSNAMKSFMPIRTNVSEHVLPLSNLGCLNLCTFGWVTPIVIRIYCKGIDTLQSYKLADSDGAETSAKRLERLWMAELEEKGPEKATFQRVVFRAFKTRFICTFICLLLFVFLSLFNPMFLIRSFLEYLSEENGRLTTGLLYVAGMMLCEFLRSLTISLSWFINYHGGLKIRAGAMTLLYKKILNLKSLREKTVGELVNLVGNDSQRIFEAIAVGPLVFAGPVAMAAGCVYAVIYLGPWALVGCAVFVGFYPFNTFISRVTTYLRRKGIAVTDKRVRMMNELLTCIKLIKMYAWEKPFAQKISSIRLEERKILEKSAMIQSISTGTAIMVPAMASTLTFIAMVTADNNLTAAQAFSFVALLNSMRFVLGVLPYGIKSLSEVTVALNRYTTVLLMQEMEQTTGPKPPDHIAVQIKDATLLWGSIVDKKPDENGKSTGVEVNRQKRTPEAMSDVKQQEINDDDDDEKCHMLMDKATNTLFSDNLVEQSTIKNIHLSLEKGKLLGVCGSVGSGKSSLINAILGRMDKVSGSIAVNGSVAYVPQQAWIMNATARENILFDAAYDEDRYNKVVEACALSTDFESLLSGDLTEIGERGVNLSGGQKQRISLARALYSNNDIYLLDDPLSAVDIHIGRHIFSKCIMGILSGKTIIFVTHQLQYLPHCDDILVLKEGQISERGSHVHLMKQAGEYAALIHMYYKEHTSELDGEEKRETEVNNTELPVFQPLVSVEPMLSHSSVGSESRDNKSQVLTEQALSLTSSASRQQGGAIVVRANGGMVEGQLMTVEESKQGNIGKEVILDYIHAAGGCCPSFLIVLIFVLSVTSQNSASVFLTYWLGQGSGNTSIQVGNETVISDSVTDHPMLSTYTIIYGMTVVSMVIFLLVRAVVFMKFTLRASSSMHDEAFGKILRCPMSFFDTTPLGRIVNRFSSDVDEVDVRLPMTAEVFLSNILHVVFSLGLISFVAPWFIIALVPLTVAFFFIFRVFTRTVRDIKQQDMISRSPLLSHITASVQGIATIHAYSKTLHFLQKYCHLLNSNTIPFVMFFISNRWLALRLDFISTLVTSITGLIIVLTKQHISPVMAGLALSSAIQMTGLFQFTVRLAIETEARFTSVERLLDYSKTVTPEAAAVVPAKCPSKEWPQEGEIVFSRVKMCYRKGLPLTLRGVSFKVKPQEKIGIVGRTGSGKSSLGVVLFRLVELSEGRIKIDSLDISTIGLEDLRSRLSIIPQDPVLFVGTVRYNLDPFQQHDDQALWKALEKCHIKDLIASLDQQLDALVVENGENFSVGERQLLCMARALLRHSKILMLDEATAAIDTETDALVQATLKEAFWDCTMLIIAHRLNTVLSCDKILVMDDGKVAEFERPSVLMSQSESAFRNMLEASEGSALN